MNSQRNYDKYLINEFLAYNSILRELIMSKLITYSTFATFRRNFEQFTHNPFISINSDFSNATVILNNAPLPIEAPSKNVDVKFLPANSPWPKSTHTEFSNCSWWPHYEKLWTENLISQSKFLNRDVLSIFRFPGTVGRKNTPLLSTQLQLQFETRKLQLGTKKLQIGTKKVNF